MCFFGKFKRALQYTKKNSDFFSKYFVQNIDNLWLTGQDVVCLGFAAGVAVGELTAGAILGYYDMPAMFAGKSLWKDLEKLPKLEPQDFQTLYTKEEKASNENGGR